MQNNLDPRSALHRLGSLLIAAGALMCGWGLVSLLTTTVPERMIIAGGLCVAFGIAFFYRRT